MIITCRTSIHIKAGSWDYPLLDLAEGSHHLTLKVWDVYNNSSDASIDFIVISSGQFALEHVINYPNPFSDHTTFSFQLNQSGQSLDVMIRIFTMNGRLVKTMQQVVYATGYRNISIVWDGSGDNGTKISPGLYVYYVEVKLADGSKAQKSSKLVYIR